MDTETIARRFIQAWTAARSEAVIDELAAPDLVVSYRHFPEPVRGPDGFREVLQQTFASFPDLETTVEGVLVDGSRAVVRWTYRGTHRAGTLFGVEPTGTRVEVPGITFYRIEAGRVVEETGVVDTGALRTQLENG